MYAFEYPHVERGFAPWRRRQRYYHEEEYFQWTWWHQLEQDPDQE